MIFEYTPIKRRRSCPHCHNYIPQIKLPEKVDLYIDGLPVNYDADYLNSCISYCSNCGLVIIAPVKHLGGIDRFIYTKPDLVEEQLYEVIYNQYGINDYIKHAFLDTHNQAEHSCVYLAEYFNNAHINDTRISELSTWEKLEYAEIARRAGASELVSTFLAAIPEEELENPLYNYVYNELLNNKDNDNLYKIIIPKELM